MKLLRCKVCKSEVEIVGNKNSICKKIQCTKCNFTNLDVVEEKKPIVILKKRQLREGI